jgi:hypothetical protein
MFCPKTKGMNVQWREVSVHRRSARDRVETYLAELVKNQRLLWLSDQLAQFIIQVLLIASQCYNAKSLQVPMDVSADSV